MGGFVKGDIVVLSFPFSDLSGAKRRPALVVADLDGSDVILCQITSRAGTDRYSIKLEPTDYTEGRLTVESVVRPNKIFTADERIIRYVACKITADKAEQIVSAVAAILRA